MNHERQTTDIATVHAVVIGRVQGVFYRQTTKDKAQSLGLVGWVRNQDDGSVALLATGPRARVEQLVEWCRKGPPSARVDDVRVEWLDSSESESSRFEILR